MKKYVVISYIIIAAVILLTACGWPPDLNSGEPEGTNIAVKGNNDDIMDKGPVKGGVINLFSTIPDTLNPILSINPYVLDFSTLIYESLVKLDRNQMPVPVLSDKWDVSSDGLIWTFHIRENVKWHDNIPLTADDVEFTMSVILNPGTKSVYKKNIENITTYAAVDRSSFRVILKKPDSFTAEKMTFPIISKHYYTGEDILTSPRNLKPMGTGPYKFVSYKEKSLITFNVNDNWWNLKAADKKTVNPPYISEVDVKIYEKGSDALSAFQVRDVDVVPVVIGDYSKYNGRADLSIRKYPGKNYEFLSFNLMNPALSDKVVRQAIAFTIDKKKIISELLPGQAMAADIPLLPGTWLYDTDIIHYNTDIQHARDILAKDGWKQDSSGLYKYINGQLVFLNFDILVNDDNETRYKVAGKIKEQLAEIGINVQVKKISWDEVMKEIGSRKYGMAMLGWSVSSIPDVSFAYSTADIVSGRNTAGYSNPMVDNLLQQISVENDLNKKKTLYTGLRNIINDDVPYIGLYFYDNAVLINKHVRGNLDPYVWDKYFDFTKWYIPAR